MATTPTYMVYGALFGATKIGGMKSQNLSATPTFGGEPTDGLAYAYNTFLRRMQYSIRMTSKDVAAVLGAIPLAGLAFTTGSVGVLYGQKSASGGIRASGSVHRTFTINEGLAVLRNLTVDETGDAEISFEIFPVYNGTLAPIVEADSAALPSGFVDGICYGLGPVTLGTETLTSLNKIDIDFGIDVETVYKDGDVQPTAAYIKSIQPKGTVSGIDPTWFSSTKITLDGKAMLNANSTICLRKRLAGGTWVAAVTAEHIVLNASGIASMNDILNASGLEIGSSSVQFGTYHDGTNLPITWDTTAAVPV